MSAINWEKLPTKSLILIYNFLTGEELKRFSSRAAGIGRIKKALKEQHFTIRAVIKILNEDGADIRTDIMEEATHNTPVDVPAAEKNTKKVKPAKAGRRNAMVGKFLFPNVEGDVNPCRPGALRYSCMQHIIDHPGISFEQYVTDQGRVGDLTHLIERRYVVVKDAHG